MRGCWRRSLAKSLLRAPDAPDDGWRLRNPGRALFAAADRFVADKLALIARDGPVPTPALALLFEHLDQTGTRPSILAARARVTRQSMTELIARAEAMRLVERRPAPDDARARTVTFTPEGAVLLRRLRAGVLGAEQAMARSLGKPALAELKAGLATYLAAGPSHAALLGSGNRTWRQWSVGRLLRSAARLFASDTLAVVRAGGFAEVNEGVLGLCRVLDRDGTRATVLAARARMTKPAMSELIGRAEKIGLVVRHEDADDRRAQLIRFTARGALLLEMAREGVGAAEARLTAVAGEPFVAALIERLTAYAAGGSPLASA